MTFGHFQGNLSFGLQAFLSSPSLRTLDAPYHGVALGPSSRERRSDHCLLHLFFTILPTKLLLYVAPY